MPDRHANPDILLRWPSRLRDYARAVPSFAEADLRTWWSRYLTPELCASGPGTTWWPIWWMSSIASRLASFGSFWPFARVRIRLSARSTRESRHPAAMAQPTA